MKIALLVVEDFLSHVKGEVITDAKKVAEYLGSEYEAHFVKTAPPTPAAPAATEPAPK